MALGLEFDGYFRFRAQASPFNGFRAVGHKA